MTRVAVSLLVALTLSGCASIGKSLCGEECTTYEAKAPEEVAVPRTPNLVWALDSELRPAGLAKAGLVVEGDTASIVVDTTQRFGGTATSLLAPLFGSATFVDTDNNGAADTWKVSSAPGLRTFYVATTGQNFSIQPGKCTPSAQLDRSNDAVSCAVRAAAKQSGAWQTPVSGPGTRMDITVCAKDGGLELFSEGAAKEWSLIQKRTAVASGEKEYECAASYQLTKEPEIAPVSIDFLVTNNGATRRISLAEEKGIWRATHTLGPGHVVTEVQIKRKDGLLNVLPLGAFDVIAKEEHSLIRIQPELLATRNFRAVNLAVAITPVSPEFFESGPSLNPFEDGSQWLNGYSPSALLRFTGDNTTVVQFGLGFSAFLNRSMAINAGVLFGNTDTNRSWSLRNNLFLGFAIDPILFLEARQTPASTPSGGNSAK